MLTTAFGILLLIIGTLSLISILSPSYILFEGVRVMRWFICDIFARCDNFSGFTDIIKIYESNSGEFCEKYRLQIDSIRKIGAGFLIWVVLALWFLWS